MPIYVYRNNEGELIELNVPIVDRDNQPGLQRVPKFTGTVWSPTANGGMK